MSAGCDRYKIRLNLWKPSHRLRLWGLPAPLGGRGFRCRPPAGPCGPREGAVGAHVRHLCPLGHDHDDPFHVILSWRAGSRDPRVVTQSFTTCLNFSVYMSNWGRHFFPGAVRRSLVFPSKWIFVYGGHPAVKARQNQSNLFHHSRINSAMQGTD